MAEELEPEKDPADSTRTQILRLEMGDNWRAWRWLQRQFSKTSIGTILALAALFVAYVQQTRVDTAKLTTRVVVLETQIVPDLKLAGRVATLEQRDVDHQARIEDLENNYSFARAHAGDPPTRRRTPK